MPVTLITAAIHVNNTTVVIMPIIAPFLMRLPLRIFVSSAPPIPKSAAVKVRSFRVLDVLIYMLTAPNIATKNSQPIIGLMLVQRKTVFSHVALLIRVANIG